MLKLIIVLIAGGVFMYYAYLSFDGAFGADRERITGCTLEAKVCPNGSIVGRSGPDCAFTPCPN